MENGYSGGNISTDSLLLARGVGGYGGYGGFGGGFGGGYGGHGGGVYTGNSVLAAEAHANGTATKEAIDCNALRVSDGLSRVSDQAEEGRRSAQVTSILDQANTNSNRISDTMSTTTLQNAINDGNVRVESVRQASEISKTIAECCCDTQKAIADAAKDAALCCCNAQLEAQKNACDTQRLVSTEAAATRALILEVESRGVRDALSMAQAKITQLETIDALSRRHHD